MDVVWLGDPACQDLSLVGGKAARLSLLAAAGFRVPPGFSLTTGVFQAAALCGTAADATVAAALLSAPALGELARAYDTLAERCGTGQPRVAVRSSAVEEDSSIASFAGAYDTYLNVAGVEAVADAVHRCWESARSPRAAAYRRHWNLPDQRTRFAVLVQQLIPADVSAVLFSADPISGSTDEIVINASWGLGETIVAGRVTPDTYVIQKKDLALVSRRIADKQRMVIPVEAGTREVDMPRLFRRRPVLDEAEVLEMARLALALEKTMGWPVDVECAWRDGALYVLQCRPVTTLRATSAIAPTGQIDEERPERATNEPAVPSPIPVPEDFPVVWEHPDDARLFWFATRMHHAEPIPPLSEMFLRHLYEHGINSGARAYNWPIRSAVRRINTYWYLCISPIALSPEELDAENTRSEQKMNAVLGRLSEFWATECLPEIQQYLTDWETFDLRGTTLPALLAHLEESIARHKRIWEIHFLLFPCLVAMNTFDELCCDLFGDDERGLDQYRLLQGLDNKSLEADRALWRLSRKARATPAVRHVLAEHDVRNVIPVLEASAERQAFLGDLRLFLAEYGRRGARITVSDPSWIEDPTPVIQNLKNYVAQPDRDLDAEMAARARERERLIEERRTRLASYPRPLLNQFEFYLKAAQESTVLEEDHNFWIDQRGVYEVRRVLMEVGRRFADAGVLDAPEDIFYLTLDELRETASSLPARVRPRHEIVSERKAEMERFRAITPPATVGTNPAGPAPDTPLGRAVHKFFGLPVAQGTDPDVVRGHPGSPGIARGPARVVRFLSEAGKLQPGDILVAEATMPPWTPLFATVAGVVTDVGGVTSHCAIVAREYQIPAVVGTSNATSVLRDGQLVEVDGAAGVVRIVSRA